MYPVANLPPFHESVSLEDLKRAFPNPMDLRAALHQTPNGDLYRKICIRELTTNKHIREAYLFAREIKAFQDRDAEFQALVPECTAIDDKQILDDLFATASPYWQDIFRFSAAGVYLQQRNIPRFIEILLTITDITLNEQLIGMGFTNIEHPTNAHVVGGIIESYLSSGQAAYSIYLIKHICPKLNPNAPTEDLLFEAGVYLHNQGKYEEMGLILNQLTTRKSELLERILSALIEKGDIPTAIKVAKNIPADLEALLYWMGGKLLEKEKYQYLPLIFNNMTTKKAEDLFADMLAALNQEGRIHFLEPILAAINGKGI